ncbi:hypothetical protein SDC9_55365 [bioreactor metagenome]|uniref:Uncharacterized protein n=1 Tax=bioreactor metagenome TaxID=1076179 RepID=A0A644WZ09_9ZZZZ
MGDNLADPTFSWFLQYKNKNGQGKSVGLTPVYENGLVKLPWVPNKLATQVPGRMQIQLYTAIITGFLWSHPLEYILPQNLDAQKFSSIYQVENDWKTAISSRSHPVCTLLHFACPKAFSVASLTALK